MKRLASAVLAGLLALPAAALALPPCVGADLATPLPDASDVTLPVMDIPAARFPGQWQQGQFKGFAYRVFPDLTAIVFDARANTGWRIDLLCTEALRCVSTDVGAVPEAARAAAKAIGEEIGRTLLLAWTGQTFALGSTPIWVRNVALAMTLPGEVRS